MARDPYCRYFYHSTFPCDVAMCLLALSTWPRQALAVQAGNDYKGGHEQPLHLHHSQPELEERRRLSPPLRVVGGRGLPEDVAEKLWAGIDLTDGERDQLQDKAREGEDVRKASVDVNLTLQVAILGPTDSGTNLIESTVLSNFFRGAEQHLYELLWKHTIGSAEDVCKRYLAHPVHENFTVMVAIRSPISQLVSWNKAPYWLKNCTARNFFKMGQPCFANASPEWSQKNLGTRGRALKHYPGRSLEFKNTMDVYNRYMKLYKGMLSEPACRKIHVQLIRYEDMVFTPGEVMAELARNVGWPVPSTINVMDSPAKQHGHPLGRSQAMEKINDRSYLQHMRGTDRTARCKELDADLVRDQFEKSFSEAPISYLKDCHMAP